jgi:L-amino acid N-acyltransferase YncA
LIVVADAASKERLSVGHSGIKPLATIREARKEDAQAIADVLVKTWQAAYQGHVPQSYLNGLTLEKTEDFWRETLSRSRSPRFQTFVAVLDERLVGILSMGPSRDEDLDSKSTAEVYSIYVLPDNWRRGIGRSLMETAMEEMRTQGLRAAILWVLETNVRTRRFYEAAGWRSDGAVKDQEFGKARARVMRYRADLA